MTITFGDIAAKSAGGTTSVNVAHPTSVLAGHILIIGSVGWPATAGLNAITGWTYDGQSTGGTGSAAGAHDTTTGIFHKIAAGGETGNVAVTRGGTPNGQLGIMARYGATNGFDTVQSVGGPDTTHGADRSMTATANLTLQVGDVIVAVVSVDVSTALTITSPTFSASGITFGTPNRRTSGAGVTTGNDGNIEVFDAEVTTGSGTVAVTLAFTTATSQCGSVRFLKLREVAGGVALTVQDALQAQATDPVALTQHNAATVQDARQLQATDPVALTQHHVLAVADTRQVPAVDNVTVTAHPPAVALTVADARQLQATDPIALIQHRVLTVQDARQVPAVDPISLIQHRVLATQDARQLQATDAVTVVYHPPAGITLTVADARQTQPVDNPTLTQHNVLAPADARQLQSVDPAALTQHHVLTPHDARQLHTADQPALTQHRVLAVADARQTQATDSITVTYHPPGAVVLTVNDARQLQATDAVNLTQHGTLTPQDTRQLQAVDPINLTQHRVLTVQDARQTQTAESPAVTPGKITLTVNDAKQLQTVDGLALTQHHLLAAADTRHNHPADSPALTQHHILVIQDARQTQRVGNITMGSPPHITHPQLQVQTNQYTLHTLPTGTLLHETTRHTLLIEPHHYTLNLEGD